MQKPGGHAGDRISTLAVNSRRHLEPCLGVPCMGAMLHAVNVRLSGQDVAKLFDHVGDTVLFVDRSLLSMLAVLKPPRLRHVVVMDDRSGDVV
ncbi:MAG: hypothetical protein JSR91_05430 [Proteobacteria bacterium]|nr:hypothetical protein [Pseudomonadota bacterium]